MARKKSFNIVFVAQSGRLQYEALILVASIRANMPRRAGKLIALEPQAGPRWSRDPSIHNEALRNQLIELGVDFVPFESQHFGEYYPNGNKIEGLTALPKGEPFLFVDTDTLILKDLAEVPFDFNKPSASLKRENTWPTIELYGPGYTDTWKSIYGLVGLDFESALNTDYPDEYWQRYPYYNAGFFYGPCPVEFGERYTQYALAIRDNPPKELVCQVMYPWLDQVALPLVIHSFGGGPKALKPGFMDGSHHLHYRTLPLLYARESDAVVDMLEEAVAPNKIKKHLKGYEPALRMIFQGRGRKKVRPLFDRDDLPRRERAIRNKIKREGLWMR